MRSKTLAAVAVAGLLVLGAHAAPPSDDDIKTAVNSYKEASKNIPRNDRAAMIKGADAALAGLSLSEASLSQLDALFKGGLLGVSPASAEVIGQRLLSLGASTGVDGCEALALRASTIPQPTERTPESMRAYQTQVSTATLAALHHPAFGKALGEGKGTSVLASLGRVSTDQLGTSSAVADLTKALGHEISPDAAMRLTAVSSWFDPKSGIDKGHLDTLRTTALAAVNSAKTRVAPDQAATLTRLKDAAAFFDGAYAKQSLVNHTAPELHFIWSNSPSPIKSLEDLRGKVVMLDFWATWCGPCIASFPNIRQLQARYKDLPVAIVGVTSIQGNHYDQKATDPKNRRIDCKDDPAKEMSLMPGFAKDMEMSWLIAFSEENVFNPSYGVFGIPHAVIIDPNGVVRHRGIHPGGDPAEEAALIDALLKEFKLSAPAEPMKAKGEEKKGG